MVVFSPLTWLLMAVSSWAWAEDAKAPGLVIRGPDVLQWISALILVLVAIGVLAWLMQKNTRFALMGRNPLRIRAALSLGVREKLVLVNVGDKQLLLAVTPGRVDKLLELDGDRRIEDAGIDDLSMHPFAQRLQQMMGKTSND